MAPRADSFAAALEDAVRVLAALPRVRSEIASAREQVARLSAAHPTVRIDVAVDLKPGSNAADYDLLLDHPDGGTVAVSYRPDRGHPWFVDYAEHWAANYVVTVTDANVRVSVQQALTALEMKADESPGLVQSLIDDALVAREAEIDPPAVSDEELQAAVDAVRAARGLHNAVATHAWLARMGWSVQQFQTIVENGVRARKISERLTEEHFEPYFLANARAFDVVRVVRVETSSSEIAQRLVVLGAQHGLLGAAERVALETAGADLEASLTTQRAHELAPELAGAPVRAVVGPLSVRGRLWVAQVLSREASTLDAATTAAVREVLLRRWLDEQLAGKEVRWHWL